jgi:hypothetical protein
LISCAALKGAATDFVLKSGSRAARSVAGV